jgi:hypothetical protein
VVAGGAAPRRRPTLNNFPLVAIAVVQGGETGGRELWDGHDRADR